MISKLTAGLDEDQAKDIRADFKSALILRNRIIKLLEDKIESNLKASRDSKNYENPNWAYKQADARGYERALYEVINILSEK